MFNIGYRNAQYRRPAGPFVGFVFLVIGIGCLWGTWHFGMQTRELLSNGLHATGQVIDVKEEVREETQHREGRSDIRVRRMTYHPVVKFEDNRRHSWEFTEQTGSSEPSYNKGESVEVIYLEKDPKGTAIINQGALNWLVPGVLGLLGVIFTLGGVWTVTQMRTA
ncbi:MAG: DUF3592 domain-containing protein [Alphaproteobacteria bacterium]